MTVRTVHLGSGLTADEFLALDDNTGELIRGEIRPKPMPGDKHSELCFVLAALLYALVGRKRGRAELDIRLSDIDVLRPDLCVLRAGPNRFVRGALVDPPLLCIEVVSPSQGPGELFDKCDRFHRFGVDYCWVIDPETQRAWEYHRGGSPVEKTDALTADEITLSLAELLQEQA